jgi:hypothetical protein
MGRRGERELALCAEPVLDSCHMYSTSSTLFIDTRTALRSRSLALTLLLRR